MVWCFLVGRWFETSEQRPGLMAFALAAGMLMELPWLSKQTCRWVRVFIPQNWGGVTLKTTLGAWHSGQ
jgi:hypothetical protein